MSNTKNSYEYNLEVAFPDERCAQIVCDTLKVDPELTPDRIKRTCYTECNVLKAHFISSELRILRVSVTGFIDMLTLATRTLREFA